MAEARARYLLDNLLGRSTEDGLCDGVERLLSTDSKMGLETWEAATDYLFAYGMPEGVLDWALIPAQWRAAARVVEACLRRFEPRLADIAVRTAVDEAGRDQPGFLVEARWADETDGGDLTLRISLEGHRVRVKMGTRHHPVSRRG